MVLSASMTLSSGTRTAGRVPGAVLGGAKPAPALLLRQIPAIKILRSGVANGGGSGLQVKSPHAPSPRLVSTSPEMHRDLGLTAAHGLVCPLQAALWYLQALKRSARAPCLQRCRAHSAVTVLASAVEPKNILMLGTWQTPCSLPLHPKGSPDMRL